MTTHRVTCTEWTHTAADRAAADQLLAAIAHGQGCRHPHTIEVHVAGADEILAAELGHHVRGLIKAAGTFPPEQWEKAAALAQDGADPSNALTSHDQATLTGDGKAARWSEWCPCAVTPQPDTWVQYEIWTADGRKSHGWVHSQCRSLLRRF
ncbi:hypothetical protein [Salinispora arenicola]|uniref:hypothetical protein n=1 Tax=Salinispora arenicola TaxID=168697 RepID=UPI00039C7F69|nr:hypothetical protein [Salinispora arenicola]